MNPCEICSWDKPNSWWSGCGVNGYENHCKYFKEWKIFLKRSEAEYRINRSKMTSPKQEDYK